MAMIDKGHSNNGRIGTGIVVLGFCILMVQFVFAKRLVEPYPAIVFPDFSSVFAVSDTMHFSKLQIRGITQTGDTVDISEADMFPQVPAVFRSHILNHIQEKRKSEEHSVGFEIGQFTGTITLQKSYNNAEIAAFKNWIRQNISATKVIDNIERVVVQNLDRSYDFKKGVVLKSDNPNVTREFAISLSD